MKKTLADYDFGTRLIFATILPFLLLGCALMLVFLGIVSPIVAVFCPSIIKVNRKKNDAE